MSMLRRLLPARDGGFAMIEIIAACIIVSVLVAMAASLYSMAQDRGAREVATTDGNTLASEIRATLLSYTTYGTTNGTINVNTTASPATVTINLGSGVSSPAAFVSRLTNGSVAIGSTKANSTTWCLDVEYRNVSAIYTENGYQPDAKSCLSNGSTGVTDAVGAVFGTS